MQCVPCTSAMWWAPNIWLKYVLGRQNRGSILGYKECHLGIKVLMGKKHDLNIKSLIKELTYKKHYMDTKIVIECKKKLLRNEMCN